MATCKEDCLCSPVCKLPFNTSEIKVEVAHVCHYFINKAQTVSEKEKVDVKHGKWVRQKGRPEAICSECGREVVYQIIDNKWWFENFCPHCGADMREEGVNNDT